MVKFSLLNLYKLEPLNNEFDGFEFVVDFRKFKINSKWGVIPFRVLDSGGFEVMIISTKRKNWSLPKGNLMKKLGPARTALLEAYEEAGIDGELYPKPLACPIGKKCIYLFPMKVTKEYSDWPEADFRIRKWMPLSKARHFLHHESMGKTLRKFFPERF